MAGHTIVHDAGMIEASPDEATGGMADTTILVGWYMVVCFTCSKRTVMAGAAVIHDANMSKGCRFKTGGLVAVTAITASWYMVRWRCFAFGGYAIVACNTVIYNAGMIEYRIRKGAWYVTDTAIFSGRDVAGILPGYCIRSIITMTC